MRIPREILNLNVTMQLTRGTPDANGNEWRLEITDRASRQIVMIADFDSEALADLMSARGGTRIAPARVNVSGNLGKTHENRTILVPISDAERMAGWADPEILEAIWARAEETANAGGGEPWIADRGERWNGHRVRGSAYEVIVRRWV